jgi:hypothetical protein
VLVIRIDMIRIAAAGVAVSRWSIWGTSYSAPAAVSSSLYRHMFMHGFMVASSQQPAASSQQTVASSQ